MSAGIGPSRTAGSVLDRLVFADIAIKERVFPGRWLRPPRSTRDALGPRAYDWTCTCGAAQSFPTEHGVFPTASRHTHPTRFDQLRHWAARRFPTRTTR